jgi:hypothetical protein
MLPAKGQGRGNRAIGAASRSVRTRLLRDFPYCAISLQIGKLSDMAESKVYKTTTVVRAKAAALKYRSDRKASKKTPKAKTE